MTRCYVVTEGETNALLLTELLKPEFDPSLGEVIVAAGQGWSGADSLARSLIVARHRPVALIVDADATDPRERRQFLESLLRRYADETMWKVFVVAPTIESILFADEGVLREFTGRDATEEQRIRAEYEPKRILQELLGDESLASAFPQRLSQINLAPLREIEWVRELRPFVGGFAGSTNPEAVLAVGSRSGLS